MRWGVDSGISFWYTDWVGYLLFLGDFETRSVLRIKWGHGGGQNKSSAHLVVLECFRIGSVHCGKAYAVGNLEEAHKFSERLRI